MKSTFKIVLTAAVLALGTGSTFVMAQEDAPKKERGPGGPGRGDQLAMMKEHLGLTDEQVAKLKPILEEQQKEMRALGQDATREQRQELRKKYEAQIKAVLTPEQVAKLDSMPRRGPGGPGGPKKDS